MVQQLNQDRRQEVEDLDQLAEAIGSWSNPEYHNRVQKHREGKEHAGGPFRIVHDDSVFQRRMSAAIRGEPDIEEQRMDVAERIRAKRSEKVMAEVRDAQRDPRIIDPFMGMSDFPEGGDALDIVIRKGQDDE